MLDTANESETSCGACVKEYSCGRRGLRGFSTLFVFSVATFHLAVETLCHVSKHFMHCFVHCWVLRPATAGACRPCLAPCGSRARGIAAAHCLTDCCVFSPANPLRSRERPLFDRRAAALASRKKKKTRARKFFSEERAMAGRSVAVAMALLCLAVSASTDMPTVDSDVIDDLGIDAMADPGQDGDAPHLDTLLQNAVLAMRAATSQREGSEDACSGSRMLCQRLSSRQTERTVGPVKRCEKGGCGGDIVSVTVPVRVRESVVPSRAEAVGGCG